MARALQGINPVRLIILLAVVGMVTALLVFIATRLTEPPVSLLFSELSPADSGKIIGKLETLNIPYELRAGGSQIFVPSDQALRLRMAMAQENLPRGGSVGYEVFDQADALGSTRSMQNINLLRALEGELARTISSLAQVAAARVHLVLPKRELFNRERAEPSASIVLALEGGVRLGKGQVAAILNLVAAAVPALKPSRIAIVDDQGTLLARGTGDDGEMGIAASSTQDYRANIETHFKNVIEGLLERSVGVGKVRAEVTAEVNFDRTVTNAEIFDPDGQVARSTQSVEEQANSTEESAAENVSVGNNLPDANAAPPTGPRNLNNTNRVEETTNFEISKTVRNHIQESGTIQRLSVAVLIDGIYTTNDQGESTYAPRGAEEIDKLSALVRSAIGFNEERGDKIELVNMQFAKVETVEPGEPPLLDLGKGDYFKIGEIAVLFIVGLLIVLLVLRPLATQALNPSAAGALTNQGGGQAALPQPDETRQIAGGEDEATIDLENVEGRVKESTMKKVGEIVEHHPDEALNIIRNWLYQEA